MVQGSGLGVQRMRFRLRVRFLVGFWVQGLVTVQGTGFAIRV